MRAKILLLLVLLPHALHAQTTLSEYWITGRLGVGTTAPQARFDVLATSASMTPLRLSGVDETPFWKVLPNGEVGMSTTPVAGLDISGVADVPNSALLLRSGNTYPDTGRRQLLLGYAGSGLYRHSWTSTHSTQSERNSLDVQVWSPAVGDEAPASVTVLSMQVSSASESGAGLHINPVDVAQVELVVSNGASYAGGGIHRASEMAPSSRRFKKDITRLIHEDEQRALEEERALKHVLFNYKGSSTRHRGLIFEETPASLHGTGRTLSLDRRVANAELAMKALIDRFEALETDEGHHD